MNPYLRFHSVSTYSLVCGSFQWLLVFFLHAILPISLPALLWVHYKRPDVCRLRKWHFTLVYQSITSQKFGRKVSKNSCRIHLGPIRSKKSRLGKLSVPKAAQKNEKFLSPYSALCCHPTLSVDVDKWSACTWYVHCTFATTWWPQKYSLNLQEYFTSKK